MIAPLLALALCAPVAPPAQDPGPGARVQVRPAPHDIGDALVRVFDVADLTGADRLAGLAQDLAGGALSPETALAALDRYVELRAEVEEHTANLLDAVRELVRPPFDAQHHRAETTAPGALTVVGTAEQLDWVRAFLASTRSFDGLIEVDARVFSVPEADLGELVGGRTGKVLDDLEVATLLRAVEKKEGYAVVTSAKIASQPYQRATLHVTDQTAYIKDFELSVLPDLETEIADPVIDVLNTGLVVDVRGVPMGEDRLALRCNLTFSSAERPFPVATVRIGASAQEVQIQLPEVTMVRAEGRFDLAGGESVMLATVDPGAGERDDPDGVVVLLTARRIPFPPAVDLPPSRRDH